ncbi:hypothetical protein D1871_11865 [Nakamurella silvestris]|nr:hypothetical protein D1871_11865 [Nakamurella silvestris]
MGLPLRLIESTGLNSYLWPGIILLVVIGGTQTVAVVAELRHRSTGLFWSAVAGLGMLIWIFVELAIMGEFTPLHGIYFVTGMAQVVLVLALLGVLPGAVGPTGPTTRR